MTGAGPPGTYATWPTWMHRSYFLRAIHVFLYLRLTSVGRICFVLLFFFGLGGASSLMIPLYIPWGFFFVMMLVSVISASFMVPRKKDVLIQRSIVPNGTAGKDLTYDIEIENRRAVPLHHVELTEWMLPFWLEGIDNRTLVRIEHLAPKEKRRVRVAVRCTRRGAFTLSSVGVLCALPFGIWRGLRRHRHPISFLVYPAFHHLESFQIPSSRQYQPGGILLSSEVGESSEFMHTREYREGDNPRHIHWASWARRGEPVVKVFQEEYFVRLALFLDSECSPKDAKAQVDFEAAISMAASIADVLSRQEYIIDLFAAGEEIHHFQAGRSLAHFENILEILACLSSSPEIHWNQLAAAMAPKVSQFSSIVMILLDWNEPRKQLVHRLQMLGLFVRTLVIRETPTTLPAPSDNPEIYMQLSPHEGIQRLVDAS